MLLEQKKSEASKLQKKKLRCLKKHQKKKLQLLIRNKQMRLLLIMYQVLKPQQLRILAELKVKIKKVNIKLRLKKLEKILQTNKINRKRNKRLKKHLRNLIKIKKKIKMKVKKNKNQKIKKMRSLMNPQKRKNQIHQTKKTQRLIRNHLPMTRKSKKSNWIISEKSTKSGKTGQNKLSITLLNQVKQLLKARNTPKQFMEQKS
jgi:hypothetical protein